MTNNETAVFGGGCFWCTEAVFASLKGIVSVMPGYAGGRMKNPTYSDVCGGATGHAEVVRVEFDPAQISYRDLLEVFLAIHDPTTLNRQGNDAGEQYRSIILYASDAQKQEAEKIIRELSEAGAYEKSIVTKIEPLTEFYEAEPYHRDFYKNNPREPYCQLVINPKLQKFKEKFARLLK